MSCLLKDALEVCAFIQRVVEVCFGCTGARLCSKAAVQLLFSSISLPARLLVGNFQSFYPD